MGTFAGHALPGSFFIILSLWGIWYLIRHFYRRRAYELHITNEPVPKYFNRVSAPLSGCCNGRGMPLDSMVKAATCIIGITGEVITGFADGKFVHIGNAQHCTMYATFALSGIVEALIFYNVIRTSLQVEYLFCLVALLAEGFLFLFHLHGRTPLDVYIHMLLLGMIITTIFAGVAEVLSRDQPVYAIVRAWTLLVQGTWFWQVGAILYPVAKWMPTWEELRKESIPAAANLFCYHLLVTFAAIVILACFMSLRLGRITARVVSKSVNPVQLEHTIEDMNMELTLYAAPKPSELSQNTAPTTESR